VRALAEVVGEALGGGRRSAPAGSESYSEPRGDPLAGLPDGGRDALLSPARLFDLIGAAQERDPCEVGRVLAIFRACSGPWRTCTSTRGRRCNTGRPAKRHSLARRTHTDMHQRRESLRPHVGQLIHTSPPIKRPTRSFSPL